MNPNRKKIMYAALCIMAIAYIGDVGYRRLYDQPRRAEIQRGSALQQRLSETKLDVRREQKKLSDLEAIQRRSLPRNLEMALAEYRTWLLASIQKSGLKRTSVDSSPPANFRNLYSRMTFSVHGSGNLEQVTQFLHTFYSAGHLHKVRSISLAPTSNGSLDVTLAIEALSLATAERKDRLASESSDRLAFVSLNDYNVIARRNLFAPGNAAVQSTFLTGVTSSANGNAEAWFSDKTTGQTHIASVGQSLVVGGFDVKILEIRGEDISIELDGQAREIRIGAALAKTLTPSPRP